MEPLFDQGTRTLHGKLRPSRIELTHELSVHEAHATFDVERRWNVANEKQQNPVVVALPTSGFNKSMQNLWLSVTNRCNMHCEYCFVTKSTTTMTPEIAKTAIDFFLNAPSQEKRIDYYGGEPLLAEDLLTWAMPYALEKGRQLGKVVRTYISTNATLFHPRMTYLRDCDVHVLVSIDGDSTSHDGHRILVGGKPSHQKVVEKIRQLLDFVEPHNLCALCTVAPENANLLLENWEYLLSIGMRCVNIEPVRTTQWNPKTIRLFTEQLEKILLKVRDSIHEPEDQQLFINSLNKEFIKLQGRSTEGEGCPFTDNFIVYPDGHCSISPTIVFEELRDFFSVGDCSRGLLPFYLDCRWDPQSANCRTCKERAEQVERSSDNDAQWSRNKVYRQAAKEIWDARERHPEIDRYILLSEKWTYV
jgi:uncharacterized protein